MVLEYILTPKSARREPYKLLPATMLFFSVGIAVFLLIPGLRVTPIFFSLIPLLPLMLRLLVWEERTEEALVRKNAGFFAYHRVLLEAYAFIFVGAMLATVIWSVALPEGASRDVFSDQTKEIEAIRTTVTDPYASGTGSAIKPDFFAFLVGHNMQVLAFMFLFSLLYGVGSLYLLLWNASILGVFIAMRIKAQGIMSGFLGGFLGLLPHGIFEVSAYFVASIAGGILSIAVMRRHLDRPELKTVLMDVLFLAAVSVVLLIIGSFIESSY